VKRRRLENARFNPALDRRELPAYTRAEAALFLGINESTLNTWTVGRSYKTVRGLQFAQPVIELADPENRILSFFNLAEAHILAATRFHHGVTLSSIRRAIKHLVAVYPATQKHPLLSRDFETDGKDMFLRDVGGGGQPKSGEEVINLSKGGQLGFPAILDLFLQHIERDEKFRPSRIYPIVGSSPSKDIAIVAGVSSGRPIIEGTGVPVWTVFNRFNLGEALESIAEDFEIPNEKVRRAIEYVKYINHQRAAA
jgi:uncharacterized protein (DUF433 family)